MKISEILTRDPEIISPKASIREAAQKMRATDCGMLPVCDGQRLLGTITDRDLTIRATAEGRSPEETRVIDVMTEAVAYCFDDDDVEQAARIMQQQQIRRLPVLNRQKRLIGILSLGDLAIRSHDGPLTEEVLERVSEHTDR